jgi:hypothetical protein
MTEVVCDLGWLELLFVMPEVVYDFGWLELYMYIVYDHIFGGFPAKVPCIHRIYVCT